MQDPLVAQIQNACDCLKAIGFGLGIVVGGSALLVVGTPIAMAVSVIALPILGGQYWMNHRNHQFLRNKTIEVYEQPTREPTGPILEKNYMKNIPKKLKEGGWKDNGSPSPFNTVRDLTWLNVEYLRLESEEYLEVLSKRVTLFACLLIPVVGIGYYLYKRGGEASEYDDPDSISPKMAVERHFCALRDRFKTCYNANTAPRANGEYFYKIINARLPGFNNSLQDSEIPKDIPVDQFFRR